MRGPCCVRCALCMSAAAGSTSGGARQCIRDCATKGVPQGSTRNCTACSWDRVNPEAQKPQQFSLLLVHPCYSTSCGVHRDGAAPSGTPPAEWDLAAWSFQACSISLCAPSSHRKSPWISPHTLALDCFGTAGHLHSKWQCQHPSGGQTRNKTMYIGCEYLCNAAPFRVAALGGLFPAVWQSALRPPHELR
jgi:hypothetical protein